MLQKRTVFRDNLSANVDIVIPEGVEEISVFLYYQMKIHKQDLFFPLQLNQSGICLSQASKRLVTDVNLPKGLTHIGEKHLATVNLKNVIPAGVTVIENAALGIIID